MRSKFEKKYLPWFTLREILGFGHRNFSRLIQGFETPDAILAAPKKELKAMGWIPDQVISNICNPDDFQKSAEKEIRDTLDNGIKILTLDHPNYPNLLKQINDPPPILTYLGTIEGTAPCIAMVGSRNATGYGLNSARNLSKNLAIHGLTIVSGMARGIDSAAHEGTLGVKGKTIAVLGSGLKRIYPKENKDLFYEIPKKGAVVSEFKLDTKPFPYNFPARNRIIAGMSCGTVIVEAARKSGSLITARLSAEYNREIFAVPGSIKSTKSQGTHALLKQGAKLVETETDILEELGQFLHSEKSVSQSKPPCPALDTSSRTLMDLMDPYPKHVDLIIEASQMGSAKVNAILLELELQGLINRHPGNYFSTSEE